MWKVSTPRPSPSGPLFDPVDPAEGQGLVPDVQLLEPGQAGPDDHVPLGPGLERPAPAQVENPLEHRIGITPHGIEACVGHVHERLFTLKLCVHPTSDLPGPWLRGTLDCMPPWSHATGPAGVEGPAPSPRLCPWSRPQYPNRRGTTGPVPPVGMLQPIPSRRPAEAWPGAGEWAPSRAIRGRFDDAPFIRACRGLTVDRVPVWFMRQAGRSLPEYRAARGQGSILDAISQPELVARLTRQPVDRYGTDAAIFFSDIVVPVAAIGFGVDVAPSTGPVVASRSGSRTTSSASGRSNPRSTRPTSSTRWASWPPSWTCPSSGSPVGPSPWPATWWKGALEELRQDQVAHAR